MTKFAQLLLRLLTPFLPSSGVSIALGAVCFAVALTPSLIPREGILQGILAGACFAVGYLIGYMGQMLWDILGLRGPAARISLWLRALSALAALVLILWSLAKATSWQEAIHLEMGMPPVETVRPLTIAAAAALTIIALTVVGRLFRSAVLWVAHRLAPLMPERLALLVGFASALVIFNIIGNDVLLGRVLHTLDDSYATLDRKLPINMAAPQDPIKSGSAQSLIPWETLGAEGRNRVLDPLDAQAIAAISGLTARDPLRIIVGLGSADTPRARAQLALDEALRQGAFDRAALVIATPTGTGWVDPAAMMPMEALLHGDVASVSVQYSYLPSWLSLLTVPEYGAETARAVFRVFHTHWRSLPADRRPKLYLFGLSLGSLNSDLSNDFYDLISDPYQGAFWVGPPFGSRSWRNITDERLPMTPEWLPRFRDGSVVRFLNQHDIPDAGKPWSPLRIVYLQYASDPITFFSPSILWREPDWLKGPRGPGVSEAVFWMPVVTFLQTGFDVITGTTTPIGHGHVYAGRDYMRGWQLVLSPEGWSDDAIARLETAMRDRGL